MIIQQEFIKKDGYKKGAEKLNVIILKENRKIIEKLVKKRVGFVKIILFEEISNIFSMIIQKKKLRDKDVHG